MNPIEDILKKLSQGKLSPEEKYFLFEWIQKNHQKWSLSMYDEYRRFIEKDERVLGDEKSRQLLHKLHDRIKEKEDGDDFEEPVGGMWIGGKPLWRILYFGVAAATLLVCSLWYFDRTISPPIPERQQSGSPVADDSVLVAINKGDEIMPVPLPDGSSVLLYPSSRVSFPRSFETKRELTLRGKAFFEIVKQPEKPFHVYANEMVTKVLGTSFLINAFDEKNQFSISVKTGKVAVSAAKKDAPESKFEKSVNLSANDRIVFDRNSREFIARNFPSSAGPEEDTPPPLPETYRFKNTPVTEILSVLARDYAIKIKADKNVLAGCALTTTLKDKPLFEKLKIICEGIGPGTHFSMNEGEVTINSPGCNL